VQEEIIAFGSPVSAEEMAASLKKERHPLVDKN
jgi:hypothetical protein